MTSLFESKVVLVTGGSSGIGRAAAVAFAREGARVVIASPAVDDGWKTVATIKAADGEATFVDTDVTNPEKAQYMVRACVEHYGGLDFAFNNAGIVGTPMVKCVDYDEKVWDHVINTNLKGMWFSMKYEIPAILARGGGAIVNMASTSGIKAGRAGVAYHASKHGVIGLTRTTAREYAPRGIRINAICPSMVLPDGSKENSEELVKNMSAVGATYPMGRPGSAKEIAESVLWMCSQGASFITGHALIVDGGLMA